VSLRLYARYCSSAVCVYVFFFSFFLSLFLNFVECQYRTFLKQGFRVDEWGGGGWRGLPECLFLESLGSVAGGWS